MKYNKVFRSLDERLGSQISVRRYSVSDMISESYKALYNCEEGTNLKRLAEAHLSDVRENPTDIDRLSRQLSIVKEVIKLQESGEISDKDLEIATKSKLEGDVEKKVEGEYEKRQSSTEEAKKEDESELKESAGEDLELTEEEVEELSKHLSDIRKKKGVSEGCNSKESVKEAAPTLSRYHIVNPEGETIDSYTERKDADEWVEQLYKDGDYKKGDLKVVDSQEKVNEASEDISVEYTYNGDETSDYTGHIKVRGAKTADHALEIAKDYIEAIRPEDEPRHFTISKEDYKNVDIIDADGNAVNESKDELYKPTSEEIKRIISYILKKYGSEISDTDYMDIIELVTGHGDVATDELDFKVERAGIEVSMPYSKSYESIDLSEFSEKSAGKAFMKTFKKMKSQLQEGKALTRQDSIALYKAANSAMTHLSVELEHNPEFLPAFKESVTLLSADVAKLLESMKRGKAPSKATMKSLAKFTEAILRESEDEKMTPDEMKAYWEKNKTKDPILANYKSYDEWYKESKKNGYVKDEELEDEELHEDDNTIEGEDDAIVDPEVVEPEESEESDEFDQEYADARVELHKELAEEHADDEDPAVQAKLAQDAEEVVNLPGVTEEQAAEILGEDSPVEEPKEEEVPEEEVVEEPNVEDDVEESNKVDEDDITEDELAELKKHLTEMRKTKKLKESGATRLKRRSK